MKIKVAEATERQIDWLVARIQDESVVIGEDGLCRFASAQFSDEEIYSPTTNQAQGGSIIDEAEISTIRCDDDWGKDSKGFCNNKRIPVWCATTGQHGTNTSYEGEHYEPQFEVSESEVTYGPTRLIAALRCYVASELGDEVEIPEKLA